MPTEQSKPIILNLNRRIQKAVYSRLLKTGVRVVDEYKDQLRELFAINNPTIVYTEKFEGEFKNHYRKLVEKSPESLMGNWVYYPWIKTMAHLLPDKDFQKVRTSRNRELITLEEQKKFYNSKIGIAGLSVGNSVVMSIVLQGGGGNLHIADFDRLSLSNLNRIRGSVADLGLTKVDMTLRQIYLLNPYARIKIFNEGLTPKNIKKFFNGLDIVVDEVDNLA